MKSIFWVFFLFLVGMPYLHVGAQEDEPIYLLSDNLLLTSLTTQNNIMQTNAALSLPVTAYNVPNPVTIARAQISFSETQLFVLLHEGRVSERYPFPINTRIAIVDLLSNQTRILLEQPGIFTFLISPDEQHMIVGYYEGDYYFSAQNLCVLEVSTGVCTRLEYRIGRNPGLWIDNSTILIPVSTNNQIPLINIFTREESFIPTPEGWQFAAVSPIPDTRMIVMSGQQSNVDRSQLPITAFFVLNLDSLTFEMLPYTDNHFISWWSFSPNNEYVVYGRSRPVLVEFLSGRAIYEFTSLLNWGWVNDHTLVAQRLNPNGTGMEIIQIDATTGGITTLAQGDQAGGILLIPHS